jgi:membrane fusion protein, multidrug efflux system
MQDIIVEHAEPVRRRSALVWVLLGSALVVLVAAVVAVWVVKRRGRAAAATAVTADRVVPVTVATVQRRDVQIFLEGLGNVVPIASVTVKTQVEGRLDKVFFTEGQSVKKGFVLAQVDPRPFKIQLHQAQAAAAKDYAQLRNAKINLDRYKTLREQSLIPQQQLDDQKANYAAAAAAAAADHALIENAKLQLDFARIVSPIDGVTGVRQIDPGNVVHAGDPNGIVVVTQLDPIAVVFTLPQDDLPRVSTQLARGAMPVDAMSRDGDQKLATGQLAVIDNQVNATTSTIRLKATFPNPTRVLWPNAFVKARMLLETRSKALAIPATAVQRGPQGTFAYVVGPDKTAVNRPIEIEVTEGDIAIVAKGLSDGETVIIDGQNQLRPGAKVAPRP